MKSKATAGLLALFLGGFGAHAFYLDNQPMGAAILMFNASCFAMCIVGAAASFLIFPIGLVLMGALAFIGMELVVLAQAIAYWTVPEPTFQRRYVVEKRWL